jgi:hypothetical protein
MAKSLGTAKWQLGSHDLSKLTKGAFIAGSAAALAYLLDYLGALDLVDPENLWAPLVISALGVVVNVLRKWGSDTR